MEYNTNLHKDEYLKYYMEKFGEIKEAPLIILQGHIILEYLLDILLANISNSRDNDFSKQGYSFSRKIQLLSLFAPSDVGMKSFIIGIGLLNDLRNKIAHKLTYNQKDADELLERGLKQQKHYENYFINQIKTLEAINPNIDADKIIKDMRESEPFEIARKIRINIIKEDNESKLFLMIGSFISYGFLIAGNTMINYNDLIKMLPEDVEKMGGVFKIENLSNYMK